MLSPVPIAVLVLVSPTILQKDIDEMIRMFNLCTPVKSVELKPYSINQANAHNVTHKDFEQHVIKWIQSKEDMQFAFMTGIRDYFNTNGEYLKSQIGNPDGIDIPNKKYYDPRVWLRKAEESFINRLTQAFEDLNNINTLN